MRPLKRSRAWRSLEQLPRTRGGAELKRSRRHLVVTKAERADPTLMNGSRRKRIAAGSGTKVSDVNQLVKQFAEMQKMMKQMGAMAKGGRLPKFPGLG